MPLDAAPDAVIAAQARVIEVLAGQVADLAARVEHLERLASRCSGNSSMPPSADDREPLDAAHPRTAIAALAFTPENVNPLPGGVNAYTDCRTLAK
jgi:hypothetical protein